MTPDQLVAACLIEGCKPVPVDAVVVGRCSKCRYFGQCEIHDLLTFSGPVRTGRPPGCSEWRSCLPEAEEVEGRR